jgi:hypothetical protein
MLSFSQIVVPPLVHGHAIDMRLDLVKKHLTFSTKNLMNTFEFQVERVVLITKRKQAETSRNLYIQSSLLHTNPLVYKQQLGFYFLITNSTVASLLTIIIIKIYLYCFIICLILL